MGKCAIITGITGQDGSYLAQFLLEKGYEVHAIIRRSSVFTTDRIEEIRSHPKLHLVYGDVTADDSIVHLIQEVKPDEFYNLAAQSHVRVSFDVPLYTAEATGVGTLRILEAIRRHSPKTRFYQASSSEMFGKVQEVPQKETTPFYPRSPYGCAKLYAYWICVNYRESYDLFVVNGILFNHESPRRGGTFVTRKITTAVARQHLGSEEILTLGNLEAKRDWGYAPEYVEAMWLMLQQKTPEDFVIATGETHTVREFAEAAYGHVGITLRWEGEGEDEKGYDAKSGKQLVGIDPKYYRPAEVDLLIGDPSKAKKILGWAPKVTFSELVKIMVDADVQSHKDGTHYRFR